MAVISIQITRSKDEIIAGIPKYVSIAANISSIIFYTLDGSTPTILSQQYVEPIKLPSSSNVILKTFATNGVDSSTILEEIYQTSIVDSRKPRSDTTQSIQTQLPADPFPFGSNVGSLDVSYLPPGSTGGVIVNDPLKPSVSNGFDGFGNEAGFTNNVYDTNNYKITYSQSDRQNKPMLGVGNLPSKVTISDKPKNIPQETYYSQKLFNPKALVVYHDADKESLSDPSLIMSSSFTLPSVSSSTKAPGQNFYVSALDSAAPTASLVRQFYNPKDHTYTYYYFDSKSLRWIISKTSYTPSPESGYLHATVFSRNPADKFVFKWYPNMRRYLG